MKAKQEIMTCVICGRQERSDAERESQWRGIEADGVMYYACPDELPRDGPSATRAAYKVAYETIFSAICIVRERAVKCVMDVPEIREQ